MKNSLYAAISFCFLLTLCVPAAAQEGGKIHADSAGIEQTDTATSRHRFEDTTRWAKVFEDPERDEWQKPDYVIGKLRLSDSAIIADVGSATGYFSVRLAKAVPHGKVYGVDIEQSMVDYLNHRAQAESLANLTSILGAPDDPRLPEAVDVIFVCDTYHHIDDRVEYFHRLIKWLRPGGRIVDVDYKPGELPRGPKPAHKLAPDRVVAEMYAAGYDLRDSDEELPYQYILTFTVRPDLHLKAGDGPGDGD